MTVRSLRAATRSLQGVALLAFPHGGQQAARRNAWAGMSADATRARARREADAAMDAAAAACAPVAAAQ